MSLNDDVSFDNLIAVFNTKEATLVKSFIFGYLRVCMPLYRVIKDPFILLFLVFGGFIVSLLTWFVWAIFPSDHVKFVIPVFFVILSIYFLCKALTSEEAPYRYILDGDNLV
jgi:uncharacterized membrane protein YfcA